MQPEGHVPAQQQVPQEQNQVPVATQAFQSVAPHPAHLAQNPGVKVELPKEKRPLGGFIAMVTLVIALIAAIGFAVWAFAGMQDYKSNSDKKSASAVTKALADQKIKTDAEWAEKDKQPYDSYSGPSAAGSIKMQYPRTWSAYITEKESASSPVVGYFHPGFVPDVQGNTTAFALRVEVANSTYAEELKRYDSKITQGTIKAEPFAFALVPSSMGMKLTGQVKDGAESIQGTMILMPLRDKTIKLWTESNSAFLKDFTTAVLPNFSFVP